MAEMVETTFYVQLVPTFRQGYSSSGEAALKVRSITVGSVTKKRPPKPKAPVVQLKLRLPAAAFLPLAPEVTIEVPENAIEYEPVVSVELPEGG